MSNENARFQQTLYQGSYGFKVFLQGYISCNIPRIFPLYNCQYSSHSSPVNSCKLNICASWPGKYLSLIKWATLKNVISPAGGKLFC